MARIGVVGAGRVGAVLSAALRAAGHEVVAAAAESDASLHRAATLLPGVRVAKPTDVARSCDLLLLTVPDDMLENVVTQLVGAGAVREGQVVCHTSGRHGLAVLATAAAVGARPIAMHPAMTFTGTALDLDRLSGCVFGMTAHQPERAYAESLVADLGGIPMWVPEDKRTLYHAGLAHGANHLVTLVSQAMELLPPPVPRTLPRTLRPLLSAALDNALAQGDAALTGPIVRGDVKTVQAHLHDIADHAPATVAVVRRDGQGHRRPGRARRPAAAHPRRPHRRAPRRGAGRGRRDRDRRDRRHGARARDASRRSLAQLVAMSSGPFLASTRGELQLALDARPHPVGLVATMGALHAGHAALLDRARREIGPDAPLVASIFVNPLQFGPGEDLDRYPRTLDADLELCADHGVDVVFAPAVEEVYPGGDPQVTLDPGPLGGILEGATRPTHFAGMLTVVAKLFGLVRPDVAVFGEKDYQQLALIRRMVRDLCLGVAVVGAETVREPDGLALSSRNRFLDQSDRAQALALSRALFAARDAAPGGADAALAAAHGCSTPPPASTSTTSP